MGRSGERAGGGAAGWVARDSSLQGVDPQTKITALSWWSGAFGVNRVSPMGVKSSEATVGKRHAMVIEHVCVSDRDFHQNGKAEQVVVPQWSSGFLENSFNGHLMAPSTTIRNPVTLKGFCPLFGDQVTLAFL